MEKQDGFERLKTCTYAPDLRFMRRDQLKGLPVPCQMTDAMNTAAQALVFRIRVYGGVQVFVKRREEKGSGHV